MSATSSRSGPADPDDDGLPPGVRLGLPAAGPGSVASWPRRVGALVIDWLVAQLTAALIVGGSVVTGEGIPPFLPLLVFFVEVSVLVSLLGTSIGHRLLGLRVAHLGGQPLWWRGVVRTALVCLVIPPVVYDRDRRGLHDLAAGTICVRV